MKIRVKKTLKVIRVARTDGAALNVTIGEVVLEQVSHFRYLGSLLTGDGYRG